MLELFQTTQISFHRAAVDLSEADVREALLDYTDKYCCYGTESLEKMKITNITTYFALHVSVPCN